MNWINILEQLPDNKEQEIIVYFKNSVGWHVSTAFWNGKTIIELCERCGFNEPWGYEAIVTHWMPLPNAPSV